jgi:hypothetical protein
VREGTFPGPAESFGLESAVAPAETAEAR